MSSSWDTKASCDTNAAFAATRWSMVIAAGEDQALGTRRAVGELVQIYWFPLYAFIRRWGHDAHDAQDLVQAFFTCMLEKKYLTQVDRSKGRFRSFLLASLKHFLSKERDKEGAQKRGGDKKWLALEAIEAQKRYSLEPADDLTPERLFERRWALALLDQVLGRLCAEYCAAGNGKLYGALEPCLTVAGDKMAYAGIATKLAMSEGSLRVAAHRMRRRYRDLLREEIAQTVDSPEQIEDEISYLLNCL
jgi:RNA polymerase sigma-70 factor (ECF subfamily)